MRDQRLAPFSLKKIGILLAVSCPFSIRRNRIPKCRLFNQEGFRNDRTLHESRCERPQSRQEHQAGTRACSDSGPGLRGFLHRNFLGPRRGPDQLVDRQPLDEDRKHHDDIGHRNQHIPIRRSRKGERHGNRNSTPQSAPRQNQCRTISKFLEQTEYLNREADADKPGEQNQRNRE